MPRATDRHRKLDVVYDGQCGFCLRALSSVRRLARRDVFSFHDANDRAMIAARFPMLEGADTEDAMFVVTPGGQVFRGFFAFRRMMWASPWLYAFLAAFYAPGAAWVGPVVYRWVARNRRRFGCAAGACELPAHPETQSGRRS